jgi:TonB family protein
MIVRLSSVRRCLSSCVLLFCVLAVLLPVGAQQTGPARRLLQRTAAPYPPLARPMALQGIVKVEAVVAPDGTVRDVAIKGGHPVLAQAAANSVRQWKWEPAVHESRETVEVKFSPE